jgi:MoaA/NifB/PqqE/SkfB family radical SAM enzyme
VPSATSEPLLNDVDTIVDHCRRHRVFVDLITNATMLTANVLDRLVPHLHALTLSLDSCVPEVFERTRYPASWKKTLPHVDHAMARCLAEQIPCRVHAVLMADTAPHLAALVDFTADRGGTALTVLDLLPNTADAAAYDVAKLGAETLDRLMRDVIDRARARRINLSLRIAGPH